MLICLQWQIWTISSTIRFGTFFEVKVQFNFQSVARLWPLSEPHNCKFSIHYLQINALNKWIIGVYLHEFTNNEREISIPHEALPSVVMEITRVELEWCYSIKAFHATVTFGHVTQRALSCVWENHTEFWERQQAFISQGADKRNLFINHRELFSWPLCLILWMISLGEIRVGGGGGGERRGQVRVSRSSPAPCSPGLSPPCTPPH